MVTRGATPLEGLPGETACGEIDPSIVLILAEKLSLGPEQINNVLTRESGLLGLTGKRTNLKEIFTSKAAEFQLPREMMQHRILSACGAGMAALSGIDEIVFSGRFAEIGEILGPVLVQKLTFKGAPRHQIKWSLFQKNLDNIIAETAIYDALQAGILNDKAA